MAGRWGGLPCDSWRLGVVLLCGAAASSFSRTFHVIVLLSLAGKPALRAVWAFIFTIPGGQNLISQAVFLVKGKFPLRMILFIFGIIFPQLFPRFSESNTQERFSHKKGSFCVSFPSVLVYRIVTGCFLKLILEKATFVLYSASTEGAPQRFSSFPIWGTPWW